MSVVKLNGAEFNTCGTLPAVGSEAPAFTLVGQDLSEFSSDEFKGKKVVLNIFPSLDTDVCAMSVRKFNQDAAGLENVAVVCVSMDLPFAMAKFCAANNIKNVKVGSAFRSTFGEDYGVKLTDGPLKGLLARSVVTLDENGKVIYEQLVDEITKEPDYESAVASLK